MYLNPTRAFAISLLSLATRVESSSMDIQPYGPRMCQQRRQRISGEMKKCSVKDDHIHCPVVSFVYNADRLTCTITKTTRETQLLRCVICTDTPGVPDGQFYQTVNGHTVCSFMWSNRTCLLTTYKALDYVTVIGQAIKLKNTGRGGRICQLRPVLARNHPQLICFIPSRLQSVRLKGEKLKPSHTRQQPQLKQGDLLMMDRQTMDSNLTQTENKHIRRDRTRCGGAVAARVDVATCTASQCTKLRQLFLQGFESINCFLDHPVPIIGVQYEKQCSFTHLLICLGADLPLDDLTNSIQACACKLNRPSIVTTLVEIGIDLEIRDQFKHTLVQMVSHFGHIELFDILVKGGCDVHAVNCNKHNILHHAISVKNNRAILTHIMKYTFSADLRNQRDVDGRTPLDHAKYFGEKEAIKVLQRGF